MKFTLIPKFNGKQWPQLELPFDGSRDEAFRRGKDYLTGLRSLFKNQHGFSIRIERTDKPAEGYEIDETGHTIE